ncbi:hypothetical protein [Nitrosospira multiformis]|uniref:hypothetical protein n=1 Tax=Nitrosospira multiformis TaxID=1231 RepID=UPI0011B1D1FD|nr:hypothetical protein [Nitrosospira multiformis]
MKNFAFFYLPGKAFFLPGRQINFYASLPEPTSTETSCFFVHECQEQETGLRDLQGISRSRFSAFFGHLFPRFVILRRIRSYGEERGGKKQEKRKGRKEKRKEGRNKERTAAGGNSSQKGLVKTAQTYSLSRFAAALCFGFIASFH